MDARILGLSSLVFLTAWATPTRIHRIDFRNIFSSDKIVINKSSPSYAALEDIRTDYFDKQKFADLAATVPAEKLITGPIHLKKAQTFQVLQLQAQVITQPTKKDYLAGLVAEQKERQSSEDYKEVAKVLVQKELDRRTYEAVQQINSKEQKRIATSSGGEIVVTKPVHILGGGFVKSPSKDNAQNAPKTDGKNPNQNYAKNDRTPSRTVQAPVPQTPPQKTDDLLPNTMAGVSFKPSSAPSRYIIKGSITFAEGAALLGQHDQMSLNQIVDGLVVKEGSVSFRDAAYTISVDSLEGTLQSVVRSPDGHITAIGKINLYDLSKNNNYVAKIQNVPMVVRPVLNGASTEVISAASYGQKTFAITDARVFVADIDREIVKNNKSGRFEDTSIVIPSNYLLLAQHPRFWPSLTIAESGAPNQLRLFPEGLVKAFLELSLDKYQAREAQQKGIIWGRIAYQGRPIAGAQVQIVGEDELKPVYFSGFIPDKTQLHTTSNGDFAFSNLETGEKLLRVSLGEKNYWPTLIPVERKTVSYADLVIEPRRTINIQSYDAFSQKPLGTILQPLGNNEEIMIQENGELKLEVDTLRGVTLIESDPGQPYVLTRVELKSEQTELLIPHINEEWLRNVRGETAPLKGLPLTQTVGFVNGDDFEVLIGSGQNSTAKIIYFDHQGHVIPNHGVSGGGYVILDLVPGRHTATIIPDRSKNIVTQTIYVDGQATNVSRINLTF